MRRLVTLYRWIDRLAVVLVVGTLAACSGIDSGAELEPVSVPGQDLFEYRITDGGRLGELTGGTFSLRLADVSRVVVTRQSASYTLTTGEGGSFGGRNAPAISSNRFLGSAGSGDSNFFRSYSPEDAVFRSDGSILLDIERRTNNNGDRNTRSAEAVLLEPTTRPEGNILERSPQLVTFAFEADGSDNGEPVTGALVLTANAAGDFVVGGLQVDRGGRLGGLSTLALRGDNDPATYDADLEFGTLGRFNGRFGDQLFTGSASLDEGDPDSILDDTYTGTFELEGQTVNWTAVPDFRDLRPEGDPEGSARFDVSVEVTGQFGELTGPLEDSVFVPTRDVGVLTEGELFSPEFRVEDPSDNFVDGVYNGSDRAREREADLIVGPDGQAVLFIALGRGIEGTGTLNPDGSVTGTFTLEENSFINQNPEDRITTEGTFTATPK